MALPTDLGNIDVYAGNPKTIILIFENVDYTAKTFRSQIRAGAGSPVLAEFAITTTLVQNVTQDTQVVMYLTGDPAIGNNTGQTRLIGDKAVFDVELLNNGVPEETLCRGTLLVTQDVTR